MRDTAEGRSTAGGGEERKAHTGGRRARRLNYNDIRYFISAADLHLNTWDNVPAEIRHLRQARSPRRGRKEGQPGVGAQYDSEDVYHLSSTTAFGGRRASSSQERGKKGATRAPRSRPAVIRHDIPNLLQQFRPPEHGGLVGAGSFVYVPAGVKGGEKTAPGLLPETLITFSIRADP